MIHLGLDLGSKTCGIAISDPTGFIARTHSTLRFKTDDYTECMELLSPVIEKEKPKKIILGNPKHMNGDEGIRAQISKDFKKLIVNKHNIEVQLWDERLTSKQVDKIMISGNTRRDKRKEKKDELAAVVILQSYLDSI